MPFKIRRLAHVVLQVSDLERSLHFYTYVLGFK
jgi:catechol 2,3-dioxygenase-like lactoylglutathione lyase family enzyme